LYQQSMPLRFSVTHLTFTLILYFDDYSYAKALFLALSQKNTNLRTSGGTPCNNTLKFQFVRL